MTSENAFCVFGARSRILVANLLFVLLCPIDVVGHGHADDPVRKNFQLRPKIFHRLLNLLEQLHRGVSWECHPLEHEKFSVEIVHFSVVLGLSDPAKARAASELVFHLSQNITLNARRRAPWLHIPGKCCRVSRSTIPRIHFEIDRCDAKMSHHF